MFLYKLKEGSKIKADCFGDGGKKVGDTITFHHTDGLYSYCTIDWMPKGKNVIHLHGMTPLRKVGKYYKIVETKKKD